MPDPRITTWSALLAVWSDFARAAGSLPKVGDAGLLRRSVPGIIGLQSLTFALEHLDEIPAEEYCSGQDRAALTIRTLTAELNSIWNGQPMPPALHELIDEAGRALKATRSAGYEYVPETSGYVLLADPDQLGSWLDQNGFEGSAWLAAKGKRIRAGAPVAFIAGIGGRSLPRTFLDAFAEFLPNCLWSRVPVLRQVFEQPDPRGIRQSVRAGEDPAPGTPLLEQIRPRGLTADVVPQHGRDRASAASASL